MLNVIWEANDLKLPKLNCTNTNAPSPGVNLRNFRKLFSYVKVAHIFSYDNTSFLEVEVITTLLYLFAEALRGRCV